MHAWGYIIDKQGSTADLNPYRYAGYRYDDTTGLYYLINRYYDASVGRFLSVDPVSEIPDYTYGANNPLSFVDPDGMWILDALWLVVDVVCFAVSPSPAGLANIAMDLACFADPIGVASTAIHVGRLANAANKVIKTVKNVGKITSKGNTVRKASKRLEYMGRTPGKSSKTGREVIDRMTQEGKIQTVRGETQFMAGNGKWYPLNEADMAHKTNAVTWWNSVGRNYGAKSPEVRKWMLDSQNYELEHFSINRSQGGRLKETYLPPLK